MVPQSVFGPSSTFGRPLIWQSVKYISLNNKPYIARPTVIDPNDLRYYRFMVNLDWIDMLQVVIFKTIEISSMIFDLPDKICVPNKGKYSKPLVEHISCDCKFRSHGDIELKPKVKQNEWCEKPLKQNICKENCIWNPTICACKCDRNCIRNLHDFVF